MMCSQFSFIYRQGPLATKQPRSQPSRLLHLERTWTSCQMEQGDVKKNTYSRTKTCSPNDTFRRCSRKLR